MTIDVITTAQGFESLADQWHRLLRQSGSDSPFLTHDWYQCCILAEPSHPLHILVARLHSEITGIAPLWLRPVCLRGISVNGLTFIDSSETAESDLILHPDTREVTLRAFLGHFMGSRHAAWDIVRLGQWPADSENWRSFTNLLHVMEVRRFTGTTSVTPYVTIAGGWDVFWKSRSYLFRKSRRGIMNRIARAGDVQIALLEGDRGDEAMDLYRTVSEYGWKQREGLSLSGHPATERFLRCLSKTAGRRGWLMLWVLRIQGAPVAVEFDLAVGRRVFALRADFDEELAALSPGAYLEYHIMRYLFDHGYEEYNAGPGRAAYKARWSESERTNLSVTVCRPTIGGLYLWLLEGWVAPRARRIRTSLARSYASGE